jgi:replicative DNA helicase
MPIEAERAAVGCVLAAAALNVDAGHRALQRVIAAGLDAEHFAIESHGELFRTIRRMADESLPLDAVSVAAQLDHEHADPRLIARLRVLAAEVATVSACERYARIVIDAAVRREIEERSAA